MHASSCTVRQTCRMCRAYALLLVLTGAGTWQPPPGLRRPSKSSASLIAGATDRDQPQPSSTRSEDGERRWVPCLSCFSVRCTILPHISASSWCPRHFYMQRSTFWQIANKYCGKMFCTGESCVSGWSEGRGPALSHQPAIIQCIRYLTSFWSAQGILAACMPRSEWQLFTWW
jgi:hypothetical protein